MPQVALPYFGDLDTEAVEYRRIGIAAGGGEISLDLNFDKTSVSPEQSEQVREFLENLEMHLVTARTYITNNYLDAAAGFGTRFYLEFHQEEMGKEALCEALELDVHADDMDLQLLAKLQPVRVGLYVRDSKDFAIVDYSFGRELTNYVLVIVLNTVGELNRITVES